eukprot:4796361-Amphidinium_carterae.1
MRCTRSWHWAALTRETSNSFSKSEKQLASTVATPLQMRASTVPLANHRLGLWSRELFGSVHDQLVTSKKYISSPASKEFYP